VFAPACASCHAPLDQPLHGPVCPACWASIDLTAPRFNATELITRGRAAGEYVGALKNVIHAFKYEGRRSLALPLADMMRDTAADLLTDADCIVPVPLHPWRRLTRGFNQATDLAHGLGLPVVPALWRTTATRQQMGLPAAERQRNMRGSMRLSPLLSAAVRAHAIQDGVAVLVDDVRTTGATLEACAQVLMQAGAREVRAVTVAFAR
jgi:ComF family protein